MWWSFDRSHGPLDQHQMISRVCSAVVNYLGSFSQQSDVSHRASFKRRWDADVDDQGDTNPVFVKRMRSSTSSTPVDIEPISSTTAPSISEYSNSRQVGGHSLFGSSLGRKMAFWFRPTSSFNRVTVARDSDDSDSDVKVIGEVTARAAPDIVVVGSNTGGNVKQQTEHRHTSIGKRLLQQTSVGQKSKSRHHQHHQKTLSPSTGASFSTAGGGSVSLSPCRRSKAQRSQLSSAMKSLYGAAHQSRSLATRKLSKLNCFRLEEKSMYRELLDQYITSTANPSRALPPVKYTSRNSSEEVIVLDTPGDSRDVSHLTRPVLPPSRQGSLRSTATRSPLTTTYRPPSEEKSVSEDFSRWRSSRIVNGIDSSNLRSSCVTQRVADSSHQSRPPASRDPPASPAVETVEISSSDSDSFASTVNVSDDKHSTQSSSVATTASAANSTPSTGDIVSSELQLAVSRRLESYDAACERNRQARELLRRQIADEELRVLAHQRTQFEWEQKLSARLRLQARITPAVAVEAESELSEEEEEEEVEKLVELTDEMQDRISAALRPKPATEVLCEAFNLSITRHDIQTLNGLNWLNDEVVNFYMTMLMERGKSSSADSNSRRRLLRVYAFNTFFYGKIVSQGHSAVRRWTRKVDIFSHELLLVPVHLGMHWCLMGVDLRHSRITFYDSMGSDNQRALKAMLRYLADEHRDKKSKELDTSAWTTVSAQDIPQQMNGSDCGMFACKFAEYLSRDAPFSFSQQEMPYFRRRMVYEIITNTLL